MDIREVSHFVWDGRTKVLNSMAQEKSKEAPRQRVGFGPAAIVAIERVKAPTPVGDERTCQACGHLIRDGVCYVCGESAKAGY